MLEIKDEGGTYHLHVLNKNAESAKMSNRVLIELKARRPLCSIESAAVALYRKMIVQLEDAK